MILNAEAIVGSYLREHPDLIAIEARVLGSAPKKTGKPWVRTTLLDPENVTGTNQVEHLVAYYMQLDCYAGSEGGQPAAFRLAKAVRAALVDITKAELEGAVATDVEFPSMPRIPDTDFEPARERFVLDACVYMHPTS
jgi:hypothetical protein